MGIVNIVSQVSGLKYVSLQLSVFAVLLVLGGCSTTTDKAMDYPNWWPPVGQYEDIVENIQGRYLCRGKSRDSGTDIYVRRKSNFSDFIIHNESLSCEFVEFRRNKKGNLEVILLNDDNQTIDQQVLVQGEEFVIEEGWLWLRDPPDAWHKRRLGKMKTYFSLTTDRNLVAKYHSISVESTLFWQWLYRGVDYGMFKRIED